MPIKSPVPFWISAATSMVRNWLEKNRRNFKSCSRYAWRFSTGFWLSDRRYVEPVGKNRFWRLYCATRGSGNCICLEQAVKRPGVTGKEVIAATEYILPCFEIVDSRIRDWQIKIEDTIADNASCGTFVLGETGGNANKLDLANLEVVVHKNGKELSRGFGSAVQDGPENAVAWLANTLGVYDIPLDSSEIILSGSLVPLEPVKPGDEMQMHIDGLGDCSVSFI